MRGVQFDIVESRALGVACRPAIVVDDPRNLTGFERPRLRRRAASPLGNPFSVNTERSET